MTTPIPPERFDAWRAAVAEMAGPRRAEFTAARLRQGIERQAVWVQQTPTSFQRRPVSIGMEQDGYVQIREGLAVGESAVVRGAIFLDNEWRQ